MTEPIAAARASLLKAHNASCDGFPKIVARHLAAAEHRLHDAAAYDLADQASAIGDDGLATGAARAELRELMQLIDAERAPAPVGFETASDGGVDE